LPIRAADASLLHSRKSELAAEQGNFAGSWNVTQYESSEFSPSGKAMMVQRQALLKIGDLCQCGFKGSHGLKLP
jgi:hypothetical protein